MSIINLAQHAIDETPELELLPNKTEAEVRIINVIQGTDKNGNDYLSPFFEVLDQPNVGEFSDFLGLPSGQLPDADNNKRKRRLQQFGEAFDIDWSGDVDLDDLRGKTGFVIVNVRPARDGYEASNGVSKYVAGH